MLLAGCIAVFLALPAIALALSRVLHGPAGSGQNATVDVQFNIKNGRPTKITRFEFNNVAASCSGFTPTAVSDTFNRHISVARDRTFHAKETTNGGRLTYTVSGHFLTLPKAAGRLRVKGTVPGCRSADTGKVHWSAKG